MTIVVRCATVPALALCAVLRAGARRRAAADWSEQDLATAGALRDRALAGTSAYEHVSSLVTEVGPRFAGSSGDAAAVRWALNKLGEPGLLATFAARTCSCPAGCAVRRGHASPVPRRSRWSPSRSAAASARPKKASRRRSSKSLRWTRSTRCPPTTVGGKIVFINQRMERTRDGSGYGATVRNRARGPERRRPSRRRRAASSARSALPTSASRTRARSTIASMRRAFRRSRCRIPTRTCWRASSSPASRCACA